MTRRERQLQQRLLGSGIECKPSIEGKRWIRQIVGLDGFRLLYGQGLPIDERGRTLALPPQGLYEASKTGSAINEATGEGLDVAYYRVTTERVIPIEVYDAVAIARAFSAVSASA